MKEHQQAAATSSTPDPGRYAAVSPSGWRRRPRKTKYGIAAVESPTRDLGTYTLENLSPSGALLLGEASLAVGERVRLALQVEGQPGRFSVDAFVVRHARQGDRGVFAVRFMNISEEQSNQLAEALSRMGGASPALRIVLIVDASREHAQSFCLRILALGMDAVTVQTPLDAIAWLQAKDVVVKVAVVRPRSQWPDQMLRFLATEHPRVRRVLLCSGDEQLPGEQAAESELVDARLREPLDQVELTRALGA